MTNYVINVKESYKIEADSPLDAIEKFKEVQDKAERTYDSIEMFSV